MSGPAHRNVVVKIGTSSLTDADGVIDVGAIERVVAEVATLRSAGDVMTVVTSGAIAAGLPSLGYDAARRPTDAVTLQAISSVGQPALLDTWRSAFERAGVTVGQILLAPHNFGERSQYLHARSTLARLHELGVVPLVNENDAVTDSEIRYGDNDRIAALVANMVDADTLVLLTDTDGVLTADPNVDPTASLIEEIREFDEIAAAVGGAGTVRGSGGMASKLAASKIAARSGVRTVIANALRPGVVSDAVDGVDGVGTVIPARANSMSARKLWIGFAMPAVATVVVDAGARRALTEGGRSLLAVGVTAIKGQFERRNPIEIADERGEVFAKGIARASAEETSMALEARLSGTGSAPDPLGGVVVHADDLVVIT